MRKLDVNDYFDCIRFHGEELKVKNNSVELDGVLIEFETRINYPWVQFYMLNHDGYWCFGGVTPSEKIVIAVGKHES